MGREKHADKKRDHDRRGKDSDSRKDRGKDEKGRVSSCQKSNSSTKTQYKTRGTSPAKSRRSSRSPRPNNRSRSRSPRGRRHIPSPPRHKRRSRSPRAKKRSPSPKKKRSTPERPKRHRSVEREHRKGNNKQTADELKFDLFFLDKSSEQNGISKSKARECENVVSFPLEQSSLDEEMKRRRERIEAWRNLRKADEPPEETQGQPETKKSRKEWTLDNDDDDGISSDSETEAVEEKPDNASEKSDGADPLDEFMEGIKSELTGLNKVELKGNINALNNTEKDGGSFQGFVVITGEKKRESTLLIGANKGEVMTELADGFAGISDDEIGEESFASLTSSHKKKELSSVDHSKIEYTEFRKCFYVEVPELARMTPEDVEIMRQNLDSIGIVGKDCPKPIKRWNQCGISLKVI